MSLEQNIKTICEKLAEELANSDKIDKDKGMLLNNLSEYILPKRQRIGHQSETGESKDFQVIYEYKSNGGTSEPA